MKIAIIARPFVFHGGVETATAGLVRALVERGHDVHVLSPGGQAPVPGITVHRFRLPPLPGAARALALAALARAAVARGSWDVVQSHERTLRQDVYRAGEGCHRAYLAARGGAWRRGSYHRILLALERRVFARTPHIIAIARMGRAEIERFYEVSPDRITVVYNGVDLERFHPRNRARDRAGARGEVGVPKGAWSALFVGSGFERKGLASAIEALHVLGDREARLLVVGKGDIRDYQALAVRLHVVDRVIWLGPRVDVERWYAAADVLVLPARYEPFGNVHLEALASGIPVVASTRAGGAEIIEEGVNGAVREPDDAAGIAKAFELIRERAPDDLAASARRSAEPYTWAKSAATMEDMYSDRARKA